MLVSREPAVLRCVCAIGEPNGWLIETAGSAWNALDRLQSGVVPHLLLLDVPRGDSDILHVLRWLRRFRPDLPIVMLSYPEDAGWRIESMRLGAQDYLVKPLQEQELETAIQRHLGTLPGQADEFFSDTIEELPGATFFLGTIPLMRKLRAQAELLAQADVPVLILGERGSGKKTAARLIHKLSVRSEYEVIRINCAGVSEEQLELELFGGKDTLSGNGQAKPGVMEIGENATILLDEISELPNRLQSKLLQVLQEKRFTRNGGSTTVSVDVRVLATSTCENMEQVLSERKLREDLYYRLSAFTLRVPPLRQRREEIPLLLRHFMHKLANHYGMTPRPYSAAVIDACQAYSWPGNLLELETFVKRFLIMGEKDMRLGTAEAESDDAARLQPGELTQAAAWSEESGDRMAGLDSLKSLVQSVKLEAERNAIATALDKTGWNRRAAARLLHVSYRTLLYKIEQYHMRAPEAYTSLAPGFKGRGWKTG